MSCWRSPVHLSVWPVGPEQMVTQEYSLAQKIDMQIKVMEDARPNYGIYFHNILQLD